jgi:hypothetical protein
VEGCCECGDEPSGSFATELVKSNRSCGRSASTVSEYRLDDRSLISGKSKDFSSSLCVQTCYKAHPASCTMGTEGPIPRDRAQPGRDTDHSTPSSAEVNNEQELYILSPLEPEWRSGTVLLCFI